MDGLPITPIKLIKIKPASMGLEPAKKRKKPKTRKSKASVFVCHGYETMDGKHRVTWSKTGNLNRGQSRKFTNWRKAKAFGRKKAKGMGAEYVDTDMPARRV